MTTVVRLIETNLPDIPPSPRSEGDHVSHIINDICIRLGHYVETEFQVTNKMRLGLIYEKGLLATYSDSAHHDISQIGEIWLDDIYGTPDAIDIFDGVLTVLEIKLTWMSASNTITSNNKELEYWEDEFHIEIGDKLWKYLVQLKAYCHMLSTNLGRLLVCYVNGDYSRADDSDLVYRVWQFTFSTAELKENWAMLLAHRDRMAREEKDHSLSTL